MYLFKARNLNANTIYSIWEIAVKKFPMLFVLEVHPYY